MSDETQKPPGTEVIAIGGETLPALERLEPKHFDVIESVLDRLYLHQYRHVPRVRLVQIMVWLAGTLCLKLFELTYLDNLKLNEIVRNMLLVALTVGLWSGALSIFSRCFTRLFNFRIGLLKICQVVFWGSLYNDLSPYLLYFNNFVSNMETVILFGGLLLMVILVFNVIASLIAFKWLRIFRMVYCCLVLLSFTVLYFDEVRHFVFQDGDVTVYSDYGARNAKNLNVIDPMVDQLVKSLP